MPRPLLDRSNNDDRRQWRKQGVAVGAAASKTQAKRCGCWVPQPGQWQRVSADGEVVPYKRQSRRRGKSSRGGAASNDAGNLSLQRESVKKHTKGDGKQVIP